LRSTSAAPWLQHPPCCWTADSCSTCSGSSFLFLIGVELIETIKVYLIEDTIRVEVVLVDSGEDGAGSLLALAALTGGYFLIKRSGR
tara:strand:- start:126 stop:386 length:261 start_codon:yes stop_codon:yes gene_type:complete